MILKINKTTVSHHIFVTMLLLIQFVNLKIMVLTKKSSLVSGNRPDEHFARTYSRMCIKIMVVTLDQKK